MKQLLSIFNPSFLRSLDAKLLLTNRLLWVTKIHYVLYYSILGVIAGGAISFLYPISSNNLPEPGIFAAVMAFLIVAPVGFWVYKQLHFNMEKNFGQLFPGMEQMRVSIYFVALLAIVSVPLLTATVTNMRIANVVGDEELLNDILVLNTYEHLSSEYDKNLSNDDVYINENRYTPYYNEFSKLYASYAASHTLKKPVTVDEKDIARDLYNETLNKYSNNGYTYDHNYYKYEAETSIRDIAYAKYFWSNVFDRAEPWWAVFGLLIGGAVLLNVLHNFGFKWVFISAVAAIAIGISTGFFSALIMEGAGNNNGWMFFISILCVYGYAVYRAFQIKRMRTFSKVGYVSLILVSVVTPFIFVWWAVTMNSLDIPTFLFRDSYGYGYNSLNVELALTLGGLFHLFIAMPFFRTLFLHAQSVPKQ